MGGGFVEELVSEERLEGFDTLKRFYSLIWMKVCKPKDYANLRFRQFESQGVD